MICGLLTHDCMFYTVRLLASSLSDGPLYTSWTDCWSRLSKQVGWFTYQLASGCLAIMLTACVVFLVYCLLRLFEILNPKDSLPKQVEKANWWVRLTGITCSTAVTSEIGSESFLSRVESADLRFNRRLLTRKNCSCILYYVFIQTCIHKCQLWEDEGICHPIFGLGYTCWEIPLNV